MIVAAKEDEANTKARSVSERVATMFYDKGKVMRENLESSDEKEMIERSELMEWGCAVRMIED